MEQRAVDCRVVPECMTACVVTGKFDAWEAVAFDVGVQVAEGVIPKWCMTALGRAEAGPPCWLYPLRPGRFSRPGH